MSWFSDLTGFSESRAAVRDNLELDGTSLISKANGRIMEAGSLATPTLDELESLVEEVRRDGALERCGLEGHLMAVTEVVGDAGVLHRDPANAGAFFQVASQFNLLEMPEPEVTPEDGVSDYQYDYTQGPACAIACGAGTIVRNWFVEIDGKVGQTADRQLDMLADVGEDLDNDDGRLWEMRNGYALANGAGLDDLPPLHGELRIGIQANTEVTTAAEPHLVTQAYCSALPIMSVDASTLEPLAVMILNSSYAATMAAAVHHVSEGGSPIVYLTLVGGGVFHNRASWILDALGNALDPYRSLGLDVRIVSYGSSNPLLRPLLTG